MLLCIEYTYYYVFKNATKPDAPLLKALIDLNEGKWMIEI